MDGQVSGSRLQASAAADQGYSSTKRQSDKVEPPLARVVEHTVIPHLLLRCREAEPDRTPTRLHVETLVRLLLSRDDRAAAAQVADLRRNEFAVDCLLHELVVPAARRLGELWHNDSVDFVDVAVAMNRLNALVRDLCMAPAARHRPSGVAPAVIITSPEDERHGLGGMIAAHDFRVAGWHVSEQPGAQAAALFAAVAAARVDLVGLSAGSMARLAGLAPLVGELRRRSRNNRLLITISGAAALASPSRALAVGADFVAQDGREAVRIATEYLSRRGAARNVGIGAAE